MLHLEFEIILAKKTSCAKQSWGIVHLARDFSSSALSPSLKQQKVGTAQTCTCSASTTNLGKLFPVSVPRFPRRFSCTCFLIIALLFRSNRRELMVRCTARHHGTLICFFA